MGKINTSDKFMSENREKKENIDDRNFYINLHLKDRLDIIAC